MPERRCIRAARLAVVSPGVLAHMGMMETLEQTPRRHAEENAIQIRMLPIRVSRAGEFARGRSSRAVIIERYTRFPRRALIWINRRAATSPRPHEALPINAF